MKLVSKEHGQSLQLFSPEDVRPETGTYYPDLVQRILDRYQLVSGPANLEETLKVNGMKFQMGKLPHNPDIQIRNLDIYNDGIIAITYDTDTSDAVVDDVLGWLIRDLRFRTPQTLRPRIYSSSVVVQFDDTINKLIRAWDNLKDAIASAWANTQKTTIDYYLQSIAFQADPGVMPAGINTKFVLERRNNRPYAENYYFSSGPLPTRIHIAMLGQFEANVMSVS